MQIEIPLKPNSEQKVVFSKDSVSYEDVSILYSDVVGITVYSGYVHGQYFDNSVGFIKLRSSSNTIKLKIRNFSFSGHDTTEVSNYRKICTEVQKRIYNLVLHRLLKQIFFLNETIVIGSLAINRECATCTTAFDTRRVTWDLSPRVENTAKAPWWSFVTQTGIMELTYFHPPTGKVIRVGSVTSHDENGILLPLIVKYVIDITTDPA